MILAKRLSMLVVISMVVSLRAIGATCGAEECSVIQPEPCEKDSVANVKVHALTIDSIQFANIDKKGCIIDDYGTQIEGRYVKYLAQRIFYRALIPDTLITLDVKFFNPQGKLMRDTDSPEECSCRVSFRTGNNDEPHLQHLGKLKAKFGKGYRMEIYDGSVCLASIGVPTRGLITYVPIMIGNGGPWTDKARQFWVMTPERQAIAYQILHMRNYTGPFMSEYIAGWKAVEK